jgi:hypothetical protein
MQLYATLKGALPDVSTQVDQNGSAARAALCWVADFDSLGLQVTSTNTGQFLQRFAMGVIYYRFVGTTGARENDLVDMNWVSASSECNWELVLCDGEDRVVGLSLGGLGLTGAIPTELVLLTKLTSLDVSYNFLSGVIPPELWSMTYLEELRLSGNGVSGQLSNSLTNLSKLRILDLSVNPFVGKLPQFGLLTNLLMLHLEDNVDLTGILPDLSTLSDLSKSPRTDSILLRRIHIRSL